MDKIKELLQKNQDKIFISIGMILVGIICFGLGRLTMVEKDIPITISNNENKIQDNNENSSSSENDDFLGKYVGNITGNTYFAASKLKINEIGDDNLIWFDSKEDAEEQGYTNKDLADSADNISENSADSGKYVASKSGTKYYLPTCSGVKRIKEENKVFFNSEDEAKAEGLEPAKNCPGLSE